MTRRIVAAVGDLFFAARIAAAAQALDVQVEVVGLERALEACRAAPVTLVLVDLDAPGAVELVGALKADAGLAGVEVIGFYPHVRTDVRAAAVAAGIDRAMARSAFTTLLPRLLLGTAPDAR